jgi:hypothetical protein
MLAGCDSIDYLPLLSGLRDADNEDALILLRTSSLSPAVKNLGLSTIRVVEGLFSAEGNTVSVPATDAGDRRSASPGASAMPSPPTSPMRTRSLAQVTQEWRSKGQSQDAAKRLDPTIVRSRFSIVDYSLMCNVSKQAPWESKFPIEKYE